MDTTTPSTQINVPWSVKAPVTPSTSTTSPSVGGLTDNQVHTIFNSQLGRDATPYELKTYAPASIQTLAGLGQSYAKLNPNSITDYMTSIGEDPSLSNRIALGQKYGITNIGTAEGNTALLNALKSGKPPTGSPTSPVTGSVTSAATPTGETVDKNGNLLDSTGKIVGRAPIEDVGKGGKPSTATPLNPGNPAGINADGTVINYQPNAPAGGDNPTVLGGSATAPVQIGTDANGQPIMGTPNTNTPTSLGGSISAAAGSTASTSTPQTSTTSTTATTDANGNPVSVGTNSSGQPIDSSGNVITSTGPDGQTYVGAPPVLPEVASALADYTSAQKAVADIDNQVAQLRATMQQTLADKKAEIARAGGVIDESQVQAQMQGTNAAIQSQIDSLLAQRGPLATQQAQYATALTQARQDQVQANTDFYKGATLAQGQEKINATAQENQVKATEFTQKLEQSGWKAEKVNSYDSLTGQVNGQYTVWTQSPGDKTGYDANGNQVSITQGSSGPGVSVDSTGAPSNPITPASDSTTSSTPVPYAQYGLLSTVKDFDPTNKLDSDAYNYLVNYLGGKSSSSSGGMGGAATYQFKQEIQSRAEALYTEATGQKLPNASTLSTNIGLISNNNTLLNQLNVQTGTIAKNFGLDLSNLTANNVNTSAPIINNLVNYLAAAAGNVPVAQYLSQNQTLTNELASLLSVKNASGTTVADKLSSATILPEGASVDQAKQVISTLMQEATNQQNTINQTNAELYVETDPLALNPQNPVNNTITLSDSSGNSFQATPGQLTPSQLQDAFDQGYSLTSQQ